MAGAIDASTKGPGVGSPTPAGPTGNAANQGQAAPASNGKPAGSPSTPSLEDAIVAERRKAEHWQHKYARDTAELPELRERLAKLEGLATGLSSGEPKPRSAPTSWQDADDATLGEAIKKGIQDPDNAHLVEHAVNERIRRATAQIEEKLRKESTEHAQAAVSNAAQKQRELARIHSDFGPEITDENSELRKRADSYFYQRAQELGGEEKARAIPGLVYDCFAKADRDRLVSQRSELETLRQQVAEFQARQEFERGNIAGAARTSVEVKDLLKQGDRKAALRLAIQGAQQRK